MPKEPRKKSPRQIRLDTDAQDLVAQIGIQPMDVFEISKHYGRTVTNVRARLVPRARQFARQNNIVIDRPIISDGYLYRARWEWTDGSIPNWDTTLTDALTRCKNMTADMGTYTENALSEGNTSLAELLEDIHDLFKVTTKSVRKARELVRGEG